MKECFIVAFLIFLVHSISVPSISTGAITFVTSFSGSQTNTPITVTVPLGITLPDGPSMQAGISLMSFQAIMSVQFIFNTSVASVSAVALQVTTQPINATYFKYLQLHYIAAQHATIDILCGCFYCANTLSGTGFRTQSFANLTTTLPISNLLLTAVISGMKISNSVGAYYKVTVNAINTGSAVIGIDVATEQFNLLEWVCVTVIAYNKFSISNEAYLRATSSLSFTTGTSSLQTYPTLSLTPNVMFFGVSSLKLSFLLASDHQFILSTFNSSNPTYLVTNANSLAVTLEQFFVWSVACGAMIDTNTMMCISNCTANYYPNSLNFCVRCSSSINNCLSCDAMGCLTCDASSPVFRNLTGQQCLCLSSYYESNGSCIYCNTSFPFCNQCLNASYCSLCFPPFNATNGACVCQNGFFLVNGVCKQLAGCIDVNNITSGIYCQQCSAVLNFVMAQNQTCVCLSYTSYNNITGKCQGICGDGKALDNICDDGDNIDNNGCANNCTFTFGYTCTNPNLYASSICVPLKSFQAQYLSAVKDMSQSAVTLYFSISPADPSLASMNFAAFLQTSIPFSTMHATYAGGVLAISGEYTETIENTQQNVTIVFDTAVLSAPPIQLIITPSGSNYALTFNSIDKFNSVILLVSGFVGGLALVFAVVSSVLGYKLIGFEILLPVQCIYLSLAELGHTSAALAALRNLSYSNSYNLQPALPASNPQGLFILQRNTEFLSNLNFSAAPFILAIIMALFLRIGLKEKEKKEVTVKLQKIKKGKRDEKLDLMETSKLGSKSPLKSNEEKTSNQTATVQMSRCEQTYVFLMDRIVVVLWVALIPLTIFSFEVQMLSLPVNSTYPVNFNIATAIFFLILSMMCLVFLANKIYDRQNRVTFHTKSRKYPVMLIAFYAAIAVVISSSFFHSVSQYLTIAISTLPVFLLIKKQPHGALLSLHSLTALFCTALLPLTIALLLIAGSLQGTSASILAFAILALILIGQGLSILRLILILRENCVRRKEEANAERAQKEDVELQSIAHETIKKSLPQGEPIFNWEGKQQDQQLKGSQKRLRQIDVDSENEEEQEEDQDYLAVLKLRLKKELQAKRGL